jgi:glycosyltransferase involved in cell wall biosynthesis
MNPRVSVIVTTFDQEPYIGEAVESVFHQSFQNHEIIVIDDGSTDNTAQKIQPYRDRVQYIYQNNQGVACSRNAGILAARGEFLAFLDGDDVWEKEKLAEQVAAAERYPESGIIAVDGEQVGAAGILSSSIFGVSMRPFLASTPEYILSANLYDQLVEGNFIATTSQVMVPARVLRDVGLSDPKFKICSDYDLYLRIAAKYPITIVKKSLTRWRYLETSASGPAELRRLNWSKDNVAILKKQLRMGRPAHARLSISRSIARTLFSTAEAAYSYGRRTNRMWAARYLLSLLAANPLSVPVLAFFLALWFPERLNIILGSAVRKRFGSLSTDG